jgi:hypothetical protein
MQRAQTINRDGEQKEMSVSEPSHAHRLNPADGGARRNWLVPAFELPPIWIIVGS